MHIEGERDKMPNFNTVRVNTHRSTPISLHGTVDLARHHHQINIATTTIIDTDYFSISFARSNDRHLKSQFLCFPFCLIWTIQQPETEVKIFRDIGHICFSPILYKLDYGAKVGEYYINLGPHIS
jgi:hypothetical protein